jgi:spermidine synthase
MDGGSWINVLKTEYLVIFIDFLARNGSSNNFAKDAVFVTFHDALVQKGVLVLQKRWFSLL